MAYKTRGSCPSAVKNFSAYVLSPDFLLIFCAKAVRITAENTGGTSMEQDYGANIISITDEDGVEYELEVLSSVTFCSLAEGLNSS